MKTKRFINGLALAFSVVMTMLFVACNPEPENEKENKLHTEQSELDPSLINPAKAVIEIYNGHLHGEKPFHQNPTSKDFNNLHTLTQQQTS